MEDKLYEDILDYLHEKSMFELTKDEISKLIYLHSAGQEKLLELWQKDHEELGFPKELNEQGYYFMLLEKNIITQRQYDILMKEFV